MGTVMGPSPSKMLRGLVFAASGAARVAGPCSNQRVLPIVQTALLCTARRPGIGNEDNLFDQEGEWTSDAEGREYMRSPNLPEHLIPFEVCDEDFPVRTLKPGTVKKSDLKAEVIRGMSKEDKELLIDVEVADNPSNHLLIDDANIMSEAIMARKVNKVTKGGRTDKFSVLIAVGDGQGLLGVASAKGTSFFDARKRAFRRACRNMWYVDLCDKRTVWHTVEAKTQASKVIIMPAPAGHGVIANKTTGALCRMMGINDVMIKTHGTPNPWSIVAAMQKALEKLTSPQEVAMVRGMRVHDVSDKMGKAHP